MSKNFKKPSDEEEDEELWIFSFADLMSLLLTFFILFFSIDSKEGVMSDEVLEQIASTFRADKQATNEQSFSSLNNEKKAMQVMLSMFNLEYSQENFEKLTETVMQQKNLEQAKESLTETFSSKEFAEESKKYLPYLSKQEPIKFVLPSDVTFRSGSSYKMSNKSKTIIKRIAKMYANFDKGIEIEISGHTDSAPISKGSRFKDNWELSTARAGAIARLMKTYGVNEEVIKIAGYGPSKPLLKEVDEKGNYIRKNMAINRRVELVVRLRR